jgi:hypothetical protein
MATVLSEPEVFVLADRALESVVLQITEDQWSMEMPAAFQTRQPTPPSLWDIINYHAYDDAWVPDMLAGRTMAEVGADKHQGDVLGDNAKAVFSGIVDRAVAAAQAVEDLTAPVHTSFGDFSVQQDLWQANFFRGLRAYDIALVLGVPADLPEALVEGLWHELSAVADEWREIGVFPPQIDVPADAPLMDRLLGLTGREPR